MLRIAEARQITGWTQEQLAEAVGTTQQTIQRWETGQTDPQCSKIKAISRILGVTVSYLMGMDDVGQQQPTLTPDERRLLSFYRLTDERGRLVIMSVAESQQGVGRKVADYLTDTNSA